MPRLVRHQAIHAFNIRPLLLACGSSGWCRGAGGMQAAAAGFDRDGCHDAKCTCLQKYRWVLMTVLTWQLDGFGLLAALKESKEYSMIPVIML